VWKFIKNYKERGTLERKGGSGRNSKITEHIKKVVDDALEDDDERTGVELSNNSHFLEQSMYTQRFI
jgi:transposase